MIASTAFWLTPGSIFSCSGVAVLRFTTPLTRGGAEPFAAGAGDEASSKPAKRRPIQTERLMVGLPRRALRRKHRRSFLPLLLPPSSLPPRGREACRPTGERRAADSTNRPC